MAAPLASARHKQGRLVGQMEALGFRVRAEAVLRTLTEDVLKSSEIEGEILDVDQVRSSIARRLGMDIAGLTPADRNVEGVVEMTLDATQRRAIEGTQITLAGVIEKARFWEKLRDVELNDRQRLVVNRLLDGFEGNLTTSKWAALTKSSPDTALRDIQHLVERGVLERNAAGGRSTSYSLVKLNTVV